MLWGVVYGESIPQTTPLLLAEAVGQGLGAMGIEVVHDQMDGTRRGIAPGEVFDEASELRARAIQGGSGEMPTCFGLHDAKHICCSAPLVFVVAFGRRAGLGWNRGAHLAMQRYRLLVQAYYGFRGAIG